MTASSQASVALPKLRQESLVQQAYQELKAAILGGSLSPGAQLAELQLADAMGISRTPVREALAMLRADGLIEAVPNGGHVVRTLAPEEVHELFLIREALEQVSLTEYVTGAGERDLDALEGLLAAQRQARDARDVEAFLTADEEFHLSVSRQAGLPQVADLLLSLRERTRQAGLGAVAHPKRMSRVLREHEAILSALRHRDPDAARRALREHLGATQRALRERPVSPA